MLNFIWLYSREHVVSVHDGMHKAVQHGREECCGQEFNKWYNIRMQHLIDFTLLDTMIAYPTWSRIHYVG